jgi:hypothetical protein
VGEWQKVTYEVDVVDDRETGERNPVEDGTSAEIRWMDDRVGEAIAEVVRAMQFFVIIGFVTTDLEHLSHVLNAHHVLGAWRVGEWQKVLTKLMSLMIETDERNAVKEWNISGD